MLIMLLFDFGKVSQPKQQQQRRRKKFAFPENPGAFSKNEMQLLHRRIDFLNGHGASWALFDATDSNRVDGLRISGGSSGVHILLHKEKTGDHFSYMLNTGETEYRTKSFPLLLTYACQIMKEAEPYACQYVPRLERQAAIPSRKLA